MELNKIDLIIKEYCETVLVFLLVQMNSGESENGLFGAGTSKALIHP